ncbi:MAG: PH domain-containing protein [Nanoarchaeota archaeon]|nr:PH domain-containing protein [Nanoarchaeota archaeon]
MSISEELHKDEEIQKQFRPHPISYLGAYIAGGILTLTLAGAVVGIPLIVLSEFIRRGNKYYITDKRVIHEFTFLSRKTSSALHEKIQDVHFSQGLIQRMFGIGNIHINTAGSDMMELKFKGIQDPISIKRIIEEHMIKK